MTLASIRHIKGWSTHLVGAPRQALDLKVLALLQGRLWDAAGLLNAQLRLHSGTHEHLQKQLGAIWRALDAIDEGRYGRCESCGVALDPDRLFDRPQRLHCAGCAQPA